MTIADDNIEAWTSFTLGRWQSTMPQFAGTYMLRTSDGYGGGSMVVYISPTTDKATPAESWWGDWWSVPLPPMPDCKQ